MNVVQPGELFADYQNHNPMKQVPREEVFLKASTPESFRVPQLNLQWSGLLFYGIILVFGSHVNRVIKYNLSYCPIRPIVFIIF